MAMPQVSFRCDLDNANDKKIYDWLENKPKTYLLKKIILEYIAREEAGAAPNIFIPQQQARPQERAYTPSQTHTDRDSLQDFQL